MTYDETNLRFMLKHKHRHLTISAFVLTVFLTRLRFVCVYAQLNTTREAPAKRASKLLVVLLLGSLLVMA